MMGSGADAAEPGDRFRRRRIFRATCERAELSVKFDRVEIVVLSLGMACLVIGLVWALLK